MMVRFRNSLTGKFMAGIAFTITTLMMVNLFWNIKQYRDQAETEMREKAAVIAQQLIATRAFIAQKQDVINADSRGNYEFKHLNPAAVGKGIGEIFNGYSGYSIKQTRMAARDPFNVPDNFEVEAMRQLAADRDNREVWGYQEQGGKRVFRYLVPLYYDQSCMPCHGKPAGEKDVAGYPREGHSPGEFAGAISVILPTALFDANLRFNITTQVYFILFIVFAGIGLTYLIMEHTVTSPIRELTNKVVEFGKGDLTAQLTDIQTYDEMRRLADEFNTMAVKLNSVYSGLEEKVAERTRMLYEANVRLAEQGSVLKAMNERLTETDRLKSEFLAVMSHELRTPLTAIIAFAEILLAEGESLSALQREYLQDIFESGHQLLDQINDILNISKIEAGLIRLNCSQVDFRELVDSLHRSIAPLLIKKDLKFTSDIPAEPPLIIADREKVAHILRNLVGNAVKFTPPGGAIHVSAGVATGPDGQPELRASVSDTGIGIEPADQERIFDKFRQADSAENRQYAGSGLGLALARNLVELHGGLIRVDSQPGRGSTFTFSIPITAKGCQ